MLPLALVIIAATIVLMVRRVEVRLVIPGGILAAYLVNVAVPNQASTAAALGPILIPLLLAAGHGPDIAGAALILGASFGGDLLNPGAQDVQAVAGAAGVNAAALSARVIPASIAGAIVAALVFPLLHGRPGRRPPIDAEETAESGPAESLHLGKALVPLLPVTLLLAAYGGFPPLAWLIRPPDGPEWAPLAGALPVVRAMLIGLVVAAAIGWRELQPLVRSFFDGMGQAYASIISLTITAQVFGAGVAAVGISAALLRASSEFNALPALATIFPWTLSMLSGSGSGPILTFAQTFLAPLGASANEAESVTLAALACFGGAFGRTMSPVSAVVVYSAGLVALSPLPLVRRVIPALLAGAVAAIATVVLRA